jgi:histidinol-phosphate/aromatic aminotransferase/cobyric acid decarboxylase-like protein
VPLVDSEDGLRADLDAVIDTAKARNAKLVFLCAPSNPAGSDIALDEVERVAVALRGQALVVVDEAYVEYAQRRRRPRCWPRTPTWRCCARCRRRTRSRPRASAR